MLWSANRDGRGQPHAPSPASRRRRRMKGRHGPRCASHAPFSSHPRAAEAHQPRSELNNSKLLAPPASVLSLLASGGNGRLHRALLPLEAGAAWHEDDWSVECPAHPPVVDPQHLHTSLAPYAHPFSVRSGPYAGHNAFHRQVDPTPGRSSLSWIQRLVPSIRYPGQAVQAHPHR